MRTYFPAPDEVVQGLAFTLAIAGAARGLGLVSGSGFFAGITIGVWVSLGLGWPGLLPVGAFFLLASAALAVVALFDAFDPALVRAGFVGAFAAAAADTLGTEVGQVLGRRPFTLLPPRSAAPGTPGAISLQGTLAGAAGALVVGFAAGWILPLEWLLLAAAGGVAGSLVESAAEPLLRRAPHRGLVANLVTTASGAALAALLAALVFGRSLA